MKKLEPDVLVFTDMLEVFAKSSNPGATLRVLDNVKKAKPPDLRLYVGSMIRADELCEAAVHESLLEELHNAMVVVDEEIKRESYIVPLVLGGLLHRQRSPKRSVGVSVPSWWSIYKSKLLKLTLFALSSEAGPSCVSGKNSSKSRWICAP